MARLFFYILAVCLVALSTSQAISEAQRLANAARARCKLSPKLCFQTRAEASRGKLERRINWSRVTRQDEKIICTVLPSACDPLPAPRLLTPNEAEFQSYDDVIAYDRKMGI